MIVYVRARGKEWGKPDRAERGREAVAGRGERAGGQVTWELAGPGCFLVVYDSILLL